MANHKIGDRVRINYLGDEAHGLEATVIGGVEYALLASCRGMFFTSCHRVDIDGKGSKSKAGNNYAFPPECLIPISKPKPDLTIEEIISLPEEKGRDFFISAPKEIHAKENV